MKNILVPTDLSLQSLSVIHEIVRNKQEKVKIHLVHMVLMPNDLSDLLFTRKSHLHAQVPNSFNEAVQLLKNKYLRQIETITLNFYYGNRTSVVNSIIENTSIDEVYLLSNHKYNVPLPSSVNMIPLIEKCKLPVTMVHPKARVFSQAQAGSLSSLLVNQHDGISYSKNATEVYN